MRGITPKIGNDLEIERLNPFGIYVTLVIEIQNKKIKTRGIKEHLCFRHKLLIL
jgi:hypothetical protein